MNILIAPDKFKGSLTANEVCEAIRQGLLKVDSTFSITCMPMADGGEGTCELLTTSANGKMVDVKVHDPLFRAIDSEYGISKDGSTAFLEMAKASGLLLLKPEERNPLLTSSIGAGELIVDALNRGVKKIVIGIGGSATNDAGMGAAKALGVEFFSSTRKRLQPVGGNLIHIHSINETNLHPRLKEVEIVIFCDVDNPLYGPNGAAYVYAPQKGADERNVKLLDEGLQNFARVVENKFKKNLNFEGAGAAGGLPAGIRALTNVVIRRGIDFVIEFIGLEEFAKHADLIITGEGKMDKQTLSGKVVKGVADLAVQNRIPVVAFTGEYDLNPSELNSIGIRKVISLVDEFTTPQEAMKNAFLLLQDRCQKELKSVLLDLKK